jgi:hypothetical protein
VSFWLVLIPALCYALASVAYGLQRNWPLAIMYSGYAWAACGALWLDRIMAR